MTKQRMLLHSARQVVQVVSKGEKYVTGAAMKNLSVLQQHTEGAKEGLSIVVGEDGKIAAIGYDSVIRAQYQDTQFTKVIDATGKTIIPGLVDGHTHPVWKGDRVHEFAMKLAGATYLEVHAAGGGIHFTVDHVRKATVDELYEDFKKYLDRMMKAGTTLVECKSGYGLDAENEIKMLEVIERGKQKLAIDISSTYCGAHAVPKGSTAEHATEDVLKEQLPRIEQMIKNGSLHVDNIDVFCEKGVFDVSQSRRILQAGKDMKLNINFHGEELSRLESPQMGTELHAHAISHLEEISDEGIAAMAAAGCVATVLPTTAYILRLAPPPVRKMIDAGVPVALGTDFNPNAHCLSMPMVMHLACVLFHMSMPEALIAATINSAASLARSDRQGSIEPGKMADMIVLDAPSWEHLIYQFGSYHHIIEYVIKEGKIVHTRPT